MTVSRIARHQIELAKASVGYVPKAGTCSQCVHFRVDKVLIPWMAAKNDKQQEQGRPPRYHPLNPENQHDINARCEQPDVVSFGVKRSGQCNNWTAPTGS